MLQAVSYYGSGTRSSQILLCTSLNSKWCGDWAIWQDTEILFPSEDESTGLVRLAWSAFEFKEENFLQETALEVLGEYLTDTSVADFQRTFIECEDPLAGGVYVSLEEFNPSQVAVTFSDVPTEKLSSLKSKLLEVLADLGNGTTPFDLTRLKTVLNRTRLDLLSAMEDHPEHVFADMCIRNYLYDKTGKEMASQFDFLSRIDALAAMDEKFWRDLVTRVFVSQPCVCVVGRPSAAKATEMEAAEKARIEARKADLGEEKLKVGQSLNPKP